MTAALTITLHGVTERDEYDETDPAKVAEMRTKFDNVVTGSLAYKTVEGRSETIRRGEFPAVGEAAEVTVTPQYSGG
jgi:hypothetical protein